MQNFLPGEDFVTFSSTDDRADFFINRTQQILFYKGKEFFDCSKAKLKGIHNFENIAAALALLRGASGEEILFLPQIKTALQEFSPSPHRMEVFMQKDNILYVNDSKGTNPHAVNAAVARFAEESGRRKNIILILGGLDKGMDFTELEESLPYVKKIILTGSCAENIASALRGKASMVMSRDFADAVYKGCESASSGDIVLFSPATASMDQFKNYARRGERYKELVREFLTAHTS